MPLYEYECKRCHHRFEQIQKFSDPLVKKCPKCGKNTVEKLLSAPAVQFKGTGWYVTDYGRKGSASLPDRTEREKDEKAEKAEKSGKSETSAGTEKSASGGATDAKDAKGGASKSTSGKKKGSKD